MIYMESRDQIKDGDVVLVKKAHNIMGKLTQYFTRSLYTHAGVAIWIDGGLYMAELNGGRNHLIPLSQLADTPFDVYECPLKDKSLIRKSIFNWLRFVVPYGFSAFVAIGIINYFRIKEFIHWRKVLVCSGYCVAILEDAGWEEHTRILSPGDLSRMLLLKFEVNPIL